MIESGDEEQPIPVGKLDAGAPRGATTPPIAVAPLFVISVCHLEPTQIGAAELPATQIVGRYHIDIINDIAIVNSSVAALGRQASVLLDRLSHRSIESAMNSRLSASSARCSSFNSMMATRVTGKYYE